MNVNDMISSELYLRLESHLRFAENEIDNLGLNDEIKKELRADLDKLKVRLKDSCVNVSVVGEFSAGKSSFLNALLGLDLLEVDDMPDTTLVPAVLFYSPFPILQIVKRNGRVNREELSLNEIKARLKSFSLPELKMQDFESDEDYIEALMRQRKMASEIASDIKQFNIGIPSDFLKQGFRLIDTPGLSSGNERCAEIAKNIMMRTDTSIIVSEATQGVIKESLRHKFGEYIGGKLEHCIVVFTRYDLTTPSRRDKLKTYLECSTRAYFKMSVDQMPIFMAVPPAIIAERNGKTFGEEHEYMLQLTRQSLADIGTIAIERREKLIAQSLMMLFNSYYERLQTNIELMQHDCESKLKELEDSRSYPIAPFVADKKKKHINILTARKLEIENTLSSNLEAELIRLKKLCDEEVFEKQSSAKDLRDYLKSGLTDFIMSHIGMLDKMGHSSALYFSKSVEARVLAFESELKEEFNRLSLIPVGLSCLIKNSDSLENKISQSAKDVAIFADAQVDQDNREIFGAVIGGIVGSLFTFGIGSAIGAVVGAYLFGGGGQSGIEGARERVRPKYEEEMSKTLSVIKCRVKNIYSQSANDMISSFSNHLNEYVKRYKSVIEQKIIEETSHQKEINYLIERYINKLIEIEEHKKQIEIICKTI